MQDAGRVVTMQSSAEEKVRLFRAMFCGREDVFAERWESKAGKTGYRLVNRIVENHLRGIGWKGQAVYDGRLSVAVGRY